MINISLAILIIGTLYFHTNISLEIRNAIILFQNNIFPSLFPFLVLTPFIIHYGFFDIIRKFLGPITKKMFRISESASYLFFMSIISGFPSSATNAKILYEENYISKKEAYHTLLFSHFSNPIFLLSMIPNHSKIVLFSHYISNFIIGIFLRFKVSSETSKPILQNKKRIHFFEIFTNSIKNAIHNSLFIFGVIVFFFMINAIFDFPIMHLLLELSQGLTYANSLSQSIKVITCIQSFLVSFGGFSVHLQTFGILSEWKISYFPYLLTRIVHGILSSFIVYLFLTFCI